jgi:putative colanic acid biosynthesis acetyltransferase WcaF
MYNKVCLNNFDNSWYSPGSKIKIFTWYFINRVFINTYLPIPSIIKNKVLRFFGSKIGNNVLIKPKVNIKYPWLLSVGDNVWIGENVWIDNLAKVSIGSNVCISQGAMLLCGNHNYKSISFNLLIDEIVIEDGVWLGAKSVVCPGITCKSHSVLTVGSIAARVMEDYTIYQGNPAKPQKKRIISEE